MGQILLRSPRVRRISLCGGSDLLAQLTRLKFTYVALKVSQSYCAYVFCYVTFPVRSHVSVRTSLPLPVIAWSLCIGMRAILR